MNLWYLSWLNYKLRLQKLTSIKLLWYGSFFKLYPTVQPTVFRIEFKVSCYDQSRFHFKPEC